MRTLIIVLLLVVAVPCSAQDSVLVAVVSPLATLEVGPGFFTTLDDTLKREGITTYIGAGLNFSSQLSAGLRVDLVQETERTVASTYWAWLRGYPSSNEAGSRLYMQLGIGTDFSVLQAGVRGGFEFPLSDQFKAFIEVEGRLVNQEEINTALTVPIGLRAYFGHRSS